MLRVVYQARLVELGEERQVRSRRGMRHEVFNTRVCRKDPPDDSVSSDKHLARSLHLPVSICTKPRRVVHVHLEQILVERVVATLPAASCVQEQTGRNVNVGSQQTWEGLTGCRLRVQQVRLAFLGKLGVSLISRKVGQPCPFKNQTSNGRKPIAGRIISAPVTEVEIVAWYAGGSVKGKA